MKTVAFPECKALMSNYEKEHRLIRISEVHYCAFPIDDNIDVCKGDGGGLLQKLDNNSNIPTAIGIVSFCIGLHNECPGFYTRVSHYLDWIEAIVWPQNDTVHPGKVVYINVQ